MTLDYDCGRPEAWPSTDECPEPGLWRCPDAVSTEVESLALLSTLVAAVKPMVAVESGTWYGYGAEAIVAGLRGAGRGHLWTVERDAAISEAARDRLCGVGYGNLVTTVISDDVATVVEGAGLSGRVEFYYCDSDDLENGARAREIRRMLPLMAPRGIIVAHDVSPVYAAHRRDVLALAEEGLVAVVMLPTPRGLAIMRRAL